MMRTKTWKPWVVLVGVCAAFSCEGYAAEANFAAQTEVPMPELGSVVATNNTVWDCVAEGIDEIGFRFMAADELPSSAVVRWQGARHIYFQPLDLEGVQPGEWVDCRFDLTGLESGGWAGGGQSEGEFTRDLRRLQWVEVQICRKGMGAQRYCLDEFYVARNGAVQSGEPEPGEEHSSEVYDGEEGTEVWWGSLREGVQYQVQHADVLEEGEWQWVDDGYVTSTNREAVWVDTDPGNAYRVYRLRWTP